MNTEALDFLHQYCDFSNPNHVWILTGISRNKDHDLTSEDHERFLTRRILTCPEDIEDNYREIKLLTNDLGTTYRMYISLNARDVIKTAFEFQKRLFDLNIGLAKGYNDALSVSKRIGSIWKTELAQSCNRGTKQILLDVDTQDKQHIDALMDFLHDPEFLKTTTIHLIRRTVSGYHIVMDACDTRGLIKHYKEKKIPVDIQRDSMVFVEQWNVCA